MMTYEEYYDDDRYLETIHEVESIRSRRESVAHPPPQTLPELPLYVDGDIYQDLAHRLTYLESLSASHERERCARSFIRILYQRHPSNEPNRLVVILPALSYVPRQATNNFPARARARGRRDLASQHASISHTSGLLHGVTYREQFQYLLPEAKLIRPRLQKPYTPSCVYY
jgi:hypothetical protein